MKRPIYALLDCNNFFVSCIRVFRPDLEGKPVVALSSNDGCVVARSNEAKMLGIPMGAPAFKWRQFFEDHGVIKFSGNFELYGDFSRRITSILATVTPRIEIYSVDESFLDLSELPIKDYEAWGKEVRARILKWTGIPVSVGIAPSKTLAKLASDRGKKLPELGGVLNIANTDQVTIDYYTKQIPLEDVWGVGRRLAPKLRGLGLANAYDLAQLKPKYAQQLMGIRGRQLVAELNGISCFGLELSGKPRKSISNTRTFGEDTSQLHVLEAAVASFAAKACHGVRTNRQLAKKAGLFIATNRHKPGYKIQTRQIELPTPTADTGVITAILTEQLTNMFNPKASYHRAGIWLDDFIRKDSLQIDLTGRVDPAKHDAGAKRMQALDKVNKRYGKHTMYFAAEDLGNSWQPKRQIQMPRYTTRWAELPQIKISL